MIFRVLRSFASPAALGAVLLAACAAEAHVVPNMTIEAEFAVGGAYTLRINVDPRTFLAADPTTLPPVPGSWYREQTPEQVAATHDKAQEYLSKALGLVFGSQKMPLPACEIQAMDGADNTPLKSGTQEVHLLATARGAAPPGASSFQIDFSKTANTALILLPSQKGSSGLKPQVVFPGETSRPFPILTRQEAPPPADAPQPQGGRGAPLRPAISLWLVIVSAVAAGLLFQGWRLLNKYRHHHRGHRKPNPGRDMNN